jgi:hypothetical protein
MSGYDEFDQLPPSYIDEEPVVELHDPLDPEQGMRVHDQGERDCSCGRPLAHARLRHRAVCACGRPIEKEEE